LVFVGHSLGFDLAAFEAGRADVATINEPLGELHGLTIIVARQVNAIMYMAVWPKDVRAVILHLWAANAEA
jgi:hypothetical protein